MIQYLNPLSWFRWFSQFVTGWFLSLPLRQAPKAFPAVIIVGILVVCTIAAASQSSDWRGRLLDRQLFAAVDRDDFETAELVLNRKLQREPDDAKLLYRLAVTKNALDQPEEARDLMRRLVDLKQDKQAARWLIEDSVKTRREQAEQAADGGSADSASEIQLSEDERAEFVRWLELVNAESHKEPSLKLMYIQHLVSTGKESLAIPLLDDLSRKFPQFGLDAAALSQRTGNQVAAERFAERTLSAFQKLAAEDPNELSNSLFVYRCQLFLKRYEDGIKTLNQMIARSTKPEEKQSLRIMMGDAIALWVKSGRSIQDETTEERLKTLQRLQVALKYAPNNPSVLTLIADQVLATLDDDDKQIAAVRRALVSGSSPGIAHFIRGTAALMAGDVDRAEASLELAAKEIPNSGAVLNNLAVTLSTREDADLERALKISSQAIDQTPQATPHYYETRGQILVRMERYVDAIGDLEKALQVPELAREAHRSLAVCYEEIGEPELSKMHRKAADTQRGKGIEISVEGSSDSSPPGDSKADRKQD